MGDLNDSIGTADAAKILGVTPGRVNQLRDELGGQRIGNSLVFSRAKVEEFAAVPRPMGWKKGKPRDQEKAAASPEKARTSAVAKKPSRKKK